LKALGKKAVAVLERLESDPDPEVAARVRRLLSFERVRDRLSPLTLSLVPDAPEKICAPEDSGWADVFVKLARDSRASRDDLAFLAPRALAGAKDKSGLYEVLHGMQQFKVRTASRQVAGLLGDPDPLVRREALATLEGLGCVDELAAVAWAAQHRSPETRSAAAAFLGRLGSRDEGPVLKSLLTDPESSVRQAAGGRPRPSGAPRTAGIDVSGPLSVGRARRFRGRPRGPPTPQ